MANEINAVAGQLWGIPMGEVYTAGPGIKIDNVHKVVSVDETVLWEGTQDLTLNTEITLSETYKNFEYIRFECSRTSLKKCTMFNTLDDGSHYSVTLADYLTDSSGSLILDSATLSLTNAIKPKVSGMCRKSFGSSTFSTSTTAPQTLIRVVGIHRISGGN